MPDQLTTPVLLSNAGATWFMVGLIWFVQIVHYPLMRRVHTGAFSAYAGAHQRRTTWIVGPVMLLEAGAAAALSLAPPAELVESPVPWIGLLLLILIWISTFAVQVPLHARLAGGFDEAVWRRLVATNWVRTVGWTARGVIALHMLQ